MPARPPRICTCGKRVPAGVLCECQARRKQETDRQRPTAHRRGYDHMWRRARETFLRDHKRCALCPRPATIVDHIKPHRGDMKLFWQRSNWQALCLPCHNAHKQSLERRGQGA